MKQLSFKGYPTTATPPVLAREDEPQSKILLKGISSCSDSELLSIILNNNGMTCQKSLNLSMSVLSNSNHNLQELGKFSIHEYIKFGLTEKQGLTLLSCIEIGRRRNLCDALKKNKINGSSDIFKLMKPIIQDLRHEEFYIILMNRANKVLDKIRISQGGISGTVIDVRIILKHAIINAASSLILCHNHPGGNVQPSEADRQITNKVKDAGKFMDVQVLDHIIIGEDNFYSFADEGSL